MRDKFSCTAVLDGWMKRYPIPFSLVGSYLIVWGMAGSFHVKARELTLGHSLIAVMLLAVLAGFFRKAIRLQTVRILRYSFWLGLLFSLCTVLGAQLDRSDVLSWASGTLVTIIGMTLFYILLLTVLFRLLERPFERVRKPFSYSGKTWLLIFGFILLCWLPGYLASWPGIYDYDSIDQTRQILVSGYVTSHHPVAHTILLSGFLKIGRLLFGSYEAGLGIFTFLQMCLLDASVTGISCYLIKRRKPRWLVVCSALFFGLLPIHQIFAVWATKDVIFTALLLFWIVSALKGLENPEEFFASAKQQIFFAILSFLLCVFRNNGLYALLFTAPFFVILCKKYRVRILFLLLIPVLAYSLYQGPILKTFQVVPGDMREMFSIPCQQLARVYTKSPDKFLPEQEETLYEILPKKALSGYHSMIADSTKNSFQTETFQKDPWKYIALYLEIGIKSPRTYIEAFLLNSLGFWYPDKTYPDARAYHPYMEYRMADPALFGGDYIYLQRHSLLPSYESYLEKIALHTVWQKIPVLSQLFEPGFYFFALCLTTAVLLYRKEYRCLPAVSILLGLWGTLILSPVALIRYAYPLILAFPLMLSLMIPSARNDSCRIQAPDTDVLPPL